MRTTVAAFTLQRLGIAVLTFSLALALTATTDANPVRTPRSITAANASATCSTFIVQRDDDYFWGMGYGFNARNTGCSTARRTLHRVDDRLFVSRDLPESAYGNYDASGASRYGSPFTAGSFTCRYTRLGSDIGKGYCRTGRRRIAWRNHVLKG